MALNLAPSNPTIFPSSLHPELSSRCGQTPPPSTRTKRFLVFSSANTRAALREWREYEEAVKRKDLVGALRFLKSIENVSHDNNKDQIERINGSASAESTRSLLGELGLVGYERDWEVLDTCLNADDMKLVASAYGFLKDRGFLPNFGKCRNIVMIFGLSWMLPIFGAQAIDLHIDHTLRNNIGVSLLPYHNRWTSTMSLLTCFCAAKGGLFEDIVEILLFCNHLPL